MDCGNFTHFCFRFILSVAHTLSPNGGHCPDFDLEFFSFISVFRVVVPKLENALESFTQLGKHSDFRVHAGRVGITGQGKVQGTAFLTSS